MLTQCSCTYKELIKYGFKPKDIRAHHSNCMKSFKTLKDYYRHLETQKDSSETLSNNLSKGDGDEANGA